MCVCIGPNCDNRIRFVRAYYVSLSQKNDAIAKRWFTFTRRGHAKGMYSLLYNILYTRGVYMKLVFRRVSAAICLRTPCAAVPAAHVCYIHT